MYVFVVGNCMIDSSHKAARRRWLEDRRTQLHLKQLAVSVHLEKGVDYYRKIEDGTNDPSPPMARALLRLFGVPSELIDDHVKWIRGELLEFTPYVWPDASINENSNRELPDPITLVETHSNGTSQPSVFLLPDDPEPSLLVNTHSNEIEESSAPTIPPALLQVRRIHIFYLGIISILITGTLVFLTPSTTGNNLSPQTALPIAPKIGLLSTMVQPFSALAEPTAHLMELSPSTIQTPSSQTAPVTQIIQVSSKEMWSNLDIYIHQGDTLLIKDTQQEQWSIGKEHGVTGAPDTRTYGDGRADQFLVFNPMPKENWGALIGRIGNAPPFFVGSAKGPLVSNQSGWLQVQINDCGDLVDNEGFLIISVTVTR